MTISMLRFQREVTVANTSTLVQVLLCEATAKNVNLFEDNPKLIFFRPVATSDNNDDNLELNHCINSAIFQLLWWHLIDLL